MTELYNTLALKVGAHGLALRGGFRVLPEDGVPPFSPGQPTATLLMIGNTGRAMWDAFRDSNVSGSNPLDGWTRNVIEPVAAAAGARAVYPYDTPPLPFQRWAERAWPLHRSPLGLLIDAEFGLWHALRAALLFPVAVEFTSAPSAASPCTSCAEKPCLTACPVEAFSAAGFNYQSCRAHLATPAGDNCLAQGCRARVACPVGREHQYTQAQLQFHQRSFSGVVRKP